MPQISAGRVLALAVSSPKRAAALPDVPSTLEAGYADSDYTFWVGVFVPAKTPGAIVDRLHRETQKAMQIAAVKSRLAELGVDPMDLSPAQFDALVAEGDRDQRRAGQGGRPETKLIPILREDDP